MHDISFIHVREIKEDYEGYCLSKILHHIVFKSYYIWDNVCRTFMHHIVVSYYIKATDVKNMVTRFVVNYFILPIDVNAVARQNVVIITFCNFTTFWVATWICDNTCMESVTV